MQMNKFISRFFVVNTKPAYEFIKEADGSINHRLFRTTPGQWSMERYWSSEVDMILGVGRPLEDVGVCNWALSRGDQGVRLEWHLLKGKHF